MTPVLVGSSFKNKGVQKLLDAIVDFLPSPVDLQPVEGYHPRTDKIVVRKPDADEPSLRSRSRLPLIPMLVKSHIFGSIPVQSRPAGRFSMSTRQEGTYLTVVADAR